MIPLRYDTGYKCNIYILIHTWYCCCVPVKAVILLTSHEYKYNSQAATAVLAPDVARVEGAA